MWLGPFDAFALHKASPRDSITISATVSNAGTVPTAAAPTTRLLYSHRVHIPANSASDHPEPTCYGVDGCRAGWVYARLEGASLAFGIVENVADLLAGAEPRSRIFIDIPVGLRDDSPQGRLCDIQARGRLRPHRTSSVFNAPVRMILRETSYRAANEASRRLTGKGISQQTWNIIGKIREVDELMAVDPLAKSLIREVHPELCFYGLASGAPMPHSKKTPEGFRQRLALIERRLPGARQAIDAALASYPRKQVAADDILDCTVAVITAANPDKWVTVPEHPELDSRGIPMEMVYPGFG